MEITTIFLAVATLMYLVLTFRVFVLRDKTGIHLGLGESETLTRAVRAHGNFIEYVPLLLFIMWMLEYNIGDTWFVWLFGLTFIIGRCFHAYGMWSTNSPRWARFVGMNCTIIPMFVGAVYLLYLTLT